MDLKQLQVAAHQIACAHGWHDTERTFGDCIALVHSELSEALEAYRLVKSCQPYYEWRWDNGYEPVSSWCVEGDVPRRVVEDIDNGKPQGVAYELADVVIRVADMAEWFKIDLAKSLEEAEDLGEAKQAYLEYRLSGNLDSFGEWIAAVHEDVGNAGYHQRDRGDNLGSHLVSVIWMVQEMAAHYGIDLDAAIEAKMEHNRTRSYRHGGKAL